MTVDFCLQLLYPNLPPARARHRDVPASRNVIPLAFDFGGSGRERRAVEPD